MQSGGDLGGLIDDFYQAAIDPVRWPDVTRRLAEATGVPRVVVGALDARDPAFAFLESHDLPAAEAPLLQKECLAYLARCELPASGLLQVILDPVMQGGSSTADVHRAGVVVGDGGSGRGVICLRQTTCRGPVPAGALEMVARVAPHFGRALQVHRRRIELERVVLGRNYIRYPDADEPVWRALDGRYLASRYGLTERELAVCEQYLNLASVEDTSAALGVEMSTVRFHLKNIYEKTGQRTLPALMRLLVESQRPLRGGEDARGPSATRGRGEPSP